MASYQWPIIYCVHQYDRLKMLKVLITKMFFDILATRFGYYSRKKSVDFTVDDENGTGVPSFDSYLVNEVTGGEKSNNSAATPWSDLISNQLNIC